MNGLWEAGISIAGGFNSSQAWLFTLNPERVRCLSDSLCFFFISGNNQQTRVGRLDMSRWLRVYSITKMYSGAKLLNDL